MKRRVIITGACIAALLAGTAAWRLQPAHSAPEPAPAPPIPVVAQAVQISDMPIVLSGIGTVTAYNVVNVHAQVAGTIDKIGFVEGQTVRPGNLIAQIDPRPFQAALQQAEAALARDTAHLANANANLHRYIPLLKQGYAPAQQVDDQSAQVTEMEAAVAGDKAAIFNARTQLGYTTINAPISGVTGIQGVDLGNIVQPGAATPIVTITQIQPISVVFTLPQSDLPAVQAAMARGPLQVIAYDQDNHTRLDEGTLLLVNNMVSPGSGTIQLKATFPNAARTLWPGAFVNVRLVTGQLPHAVSVPIDALQQTQTGSVVYVVTPSDTVQQRSVTAGETLDGRAVIEKGLQAGDIVVTEGQYDLIDHTKVTRVPAGDPHVQNSTSKSRGMLG